MMNDMIVFRPFSGKAICGQEVNLNKGDKLISTVVDGREYVCFPDDKKKLIVAVYSQNYLDHFSRNHDNNGLERGEITYRLSSQIFTDKQKEILVKKWSKYIELPFFIFHNRFYEAPLDILKNIEDDLNKEGGTSDV